MGTKTPKPEHDHGGAPATDRGTVRESASGGHYCAACGDTVMMGTDRWGGPKWISVAAPVTTVQGVLASELRRGDVIVVRSLTVLTQPQRLTMNGGEVVAVTLGGDGGDPYRWLYQDDQEVRVVAAGAR